MITFSATDIAIVEAHYSESLKITEQMSRFKTHWDIDKEGFIGDYGTFWMIADDHGVIEVHTTEGDAKDRVATVLANHNKRKVA